MRLIDADALNVSQVGICDANGNCYGGADVVFLEDINKAETIDAVEIVRYKDCGISEVACGLLTACVDDYDSRIWDVIRDDVLEDVLMCSGIKNGEGFTEGDVALSIGRAIAERLGIEV